MGRNKGGGGRSFNKPVIYELSTTIDRTQIGTHQSVSTIDDASSQLSVQSTSSTGADISARGNSPQLNEGEDTQQLEMWLAALREFLAQFEKQRVVFCQTHHLTEEVATQLAQAVSDLLTTEPGQLQLREVAALYMRFQQILLINQIWAGDVGS